MATRKRVLRGDRLKQIRVERELSQDELAERVNVGQSQLARYEASKADPSLEVVARFARELEVSADWLMGLVDDRQQRKVESDLSARERKVLEALRRGDLAEYMRVGSEQAEPNH